MPARKPAAPARPPKRQQFDGDEIERLLGADKPSDDQVKTIADLAETAIKLQDEIVRRNEIIARANERLNDLLLNKIPEAMAAVGMSDFTLQSGMQVTVKEFMHGSLPKEDQAKRRKALDWLIRNGASDLVKTTITTAFGAGDAKEAERAIAALKKIKITPDVKEDVHAQSLMAFARERLRKGEEVPLDTLGLFAGKIAKFGAPKAPKVKK